MTEQQTAELLEYVKQGVEFGKDQGPIIATEIIQYGTLANWALLGFGIVLVGFVGVGILLSRWGAKQDVDTDMAAVLGVFLSAGSFVAAVITLTQAVHGLCKVYYAPRLYILEQIAGMVGGQ
jgi:hypothetical protein